MKNKIRISVVSLVMRFVARIHGMHGEHASKIFEICLKQGMSGSNNLMIFTYRFSDY
jgi:hypothetical protein